MRTITIINAYIRAYDRLVDGVMVGSANPRNIRQVNQFLFEIARRGVRYDQLRGVHIPEVTA